MMVWSLDSLNTNLFTDGPVVLLTVSWRLMSVENLHEIPLALPGPLSCLKEGFEGGHQRNR